MVDQAAKRAEAELAGQPEVLAEVLSTIGGVYAEQGRYEQAEPILRAAFRLQPLRWEPLAQALLGTVRG